MLLGLCRSTLSRSLSAVSVSSLSLSLVISVKSAYCGNMALDDFAKLLILSPKSSRRLLTMTTQLLFKAISQCFDSSFLHLRLDFLVVGPLFSDRGRLQGSVLLVHLILISISLCYPVFPHPETGTLSVFSHQLWLPFGYLLPLITFYQSEWFYSLLTTYIVMTTQVQNLCAPFCVLGITHYWRLTTSLFCGSWSTRIWL